MDRNNDNEKRKKYICSRIKSGFKKYCQCGNINNDADMEDTLSIQSIDNATKNSKDKLDTIEEIKSDYDLDMEIIPHSRSSFSNAQQKQTNEIELHQIPKSVSESVLMHQHTQHQIQKNNNIPTAVSDSILRTMSL